MKDKDQKDKKKTTASSGKSGNIKSGSFLETISGGKYAIIILVVIVLITFSGSFTNTPVAFDDNTMLDNVANLKKTSFSIFSESFRLDAMAGTEGMFYRPLQTFTLIALSYVGSYQAYIFFLFLVHIINAFLLLQMLTLLAMERKKSFLLTLLFAVHPLFTPIISWIPSIGDALVTLFILASFILYLKNIAQPRLLFIVLHLISFLLAMFSKEIAILFPVICLIYSYFERAAVVRNRWLKDLVFYGIGWAGVIALYLLMRQVNASTNHPAIAQTGVITFLSNIPLAFQYLFKFIIPAKLSLVSINSWIRLAGGIIAAGVLLFLAYRQGKFKMLILATAWFAIFISPTLIFVHPHYDYLEHRGYLPLIAMIIILASLKIHKEENLALVAVIFVFCVVSFSRTASFSDPVSFYSRIITNEPVAMAYNNLAIEQDNRGDFRSALGNFSQAIKLKPSYADAYINRGNLNAQRLNNFPAAIADYQKAIRLISEDEYLRNDMAGYADVYNNLATAKLRLNDVDGAMQDYNKAIGIKPDFAKAFYNRAVLKSENLSDYKGALDDFSKAIESDPSSYEAYTNRGVIRELHFQDYAGALADYNKAISLKPDYAQAYYNRGLYFKGLNDMNNACRDWRTAASLGHQGAGQFLNIYCR